MIKAIKNRYKEILWTISIFLFVLLISCAITMVAGYSEGLDEQAEDLSKIHSLQFGELLNRSIDDFIDIAKGVALNMPADKSGAAEYLNSLKLQERYYNVAYFRVAKDGVECDEYGVPLDSQSRNSQVAKLISANVSASTGLIKNTSANDHGFAVYVPMKDTSCYDGLVVYYHIKALEDKLIEAVLDTEDAEFSAACTADGSIFAVVHKRDFDLKKHDNLFAEIRTMTEDKTAVDLAVAAASEGSAVSMTIGGEKYIISFDPSSLSSGELYMVSVYRASVIYNDGYHLINSVYSVIMVLIMLTVAMLLYIIVTHFGAFRKLEEFNLTDPILHCPTYKKFEAQAEDILKRNKATNFALVYIRASHIDFIEENFGRDTAEQCLKFMVHLFKKAMSNDEVFCRVEGAEFALLLHYKYEDDLYNRVNTINSVIYNNVIFVKRGFNLTLAIGISHVERDEEISIQKLYSQASFAQGSKKAKNVGIIRVYDKSLRESALHDEEIESKMEQALTAGEFRIFYQPKYDILKNRTAGAEALLRWCQSDAQTIYSPAEFVPIFEANGFIARLDHYVFTEVCHSISSATMSGETIVPISVNVSRVTVMQSDFPDFYIETKRRYGIADKFITIEFTESFAYENYAKMQKLVLKLKENGFRCSIDDFGAGYSSFNILKSLPMDELKLDISFLRRGISPERDRKVLKTMISLAKDMGMLVTQEGVEHRSELAMLRDFDCDMIQGYLYSKPMAEDDYRNFLNTPDRQTMS